MQHAALLLAAGQSSRFGSPKQAAKMGEHSLLAWAVHHARAAGCDPVLVVSGAYPDVVSSELPEGVHHHYHPGWRAGMPSTIRTGLSQLLASEEWTHCLILPADMPWFTGDWIKNYQRALEDEPKVEQDFKVSGRTESSKAFSPAEPIVATAYEAGPGLPVLIDRRLVTQIIEDSLREPLRRWWSRHPNLRLIAAGDHTRDVDRPTDMMS